MKVFGLLTMINSEVISKVDAINLSEAIELFAISKKLSKETLLKIFKVEQIEHL